MRRRLWLVVVTALALLLAGWVTAQPIAEEHALINVYVRYMEVWETAEFDVLEEVLAPGFVRHSQWGGDSFGVEGVAEEITGFLEMFGQGTTHALVEGFAHGDRALVTGTITPPGGESFNYSTLVRFENGLMVEQWAADDPLLVLELFETTVAPFPMHFAAELSGAQVVPPVDTSGSGQASAILIGDLLVVTGNYQGLSSPVHGRGLLSSAGIQIHRAPTGDRGPGLTERARTEQLVPGLSDLKMFSDAGTSGSFHGAFKLIPEQIQDLEAGLFYLVVHTEEELAGELRGQLRPTVMVDLTAGDLVGVWENRGLFSAPSYFKFSEDGTFIIGSSPESLDRYQIERGVFQLDGHHFTLTAEYANTTTCTGATGSYTVMLSTNNQLRLFPHADECPYRLADLRGAVLLPVPQ